MVTMHAPVASGSIGYPVDHEYYPKMLPYYTVPLAQHVPIDQDYIIGTVPPSDAMPSYECHRINNHGHL